MISRDPSPDTLRPDAGVTRLNRRPLAIVFSVLCLVIVVLAFGIVGNSRKAREGMTAAVQKHIVSDTTSAAAAVARDAPKTGEIPEKGKTVAGLPARFQAGPKAGLIPAAENLGGGLLTAGNSTGVTDPHAEERRRLDARRRQMLETALGATTKVGTMDPRRDQVPATPLLSSGLVPPPSPVSSRLASAAPSAFGMDPDPNRQEDKLTFQDRKRALGYLSSSREAPLSPFEMKAGTVIPAVLISGINSDLPGQIIAQVRQNVFDTATGDHLLIPQGAQLVGLYNSQVAVGQTRVQVVWTRLNFPDGSTLALEGMTGADQGGYGGFHDRVNNHFVRIFGNALMLSLISAGVQISQPKTSGQSGYVTEQQQIGAAIGQQFGAVGSEMTKRNMQIQPTLQIRPGYRFVVMVNKDVLLLPYVENDPSGGNQSRKPHKSPRPREP